KSCDQKLEGVVETPTTTVRLMRFDRLCFDLPRSSLSARFQHPEDLRERIDGQEATELGLQPAGCIARLTALPVADIVQRQPRTSIPRAGGDGAQPLEDAHRAHV